MMICTKLVSFPTRERGLKQSHKPHQPQPVPVVPYAGTWIETAVKPIAEELNCGRSLRGNVD